MSGGSFNYLCWKSADELAADTSTLAEMRDALIGHNAPDAAAETEAIIATIAQFRVLVETRAKRLNEVWHAVEWCRSGDQGPEDVAAAVAKYREGMT